MLTTRYGPLAWYRKGPRGKVVRVHAGSPVTGHRHHDHAPYFSLQPSLLHMGRTKKAARKFNSVPRKNFPEEPLYLTPSKGGGYYPATINQKIDDGKYKIVRKLGYGPRSSTWLVSRTQAHEPGHFAVKIFTVAASERAKIVELPILEEVDKVSRSSSLELPGFYHCFWQETTMGRHLCFVMNPLSTSVRDLQRDANNQRLPVHAVQRIVFLIHSTVCTTLK